MLFGQVLALPRSPGPSGRAPSGRPAKSASLRPCGGGRHQLEHAPRPVQRHRLPAFYPDGPMAEHLKILAALVGGLPRATSGYRRSSPLRAAAGPCPPTRPATKTPATSRTVGMRSTTWWNSGLKRPGPAVPSGPVDDQRCPGAPFMRELLIPPVRRISRHGPALGITGRRGRPAPPIPPDAASFSSMVSGARFLAWRRGSDCPSGPPSPVAPLSEVTDEQGVGQCALTPKLSHKPADLVVRVRHEPSVDLCLAFAQMPLGCESSPRPVRLGSMGSGRSAGTTPSAFAPSFAARTRSQPSTNAPR